VSNLDDVSEEYEQLRSTFLAESSGPYLRGGLFELGTSGACATVLCAADGATALALSIGGGQVGLGEHVPVRRAAQEYLALLEKSLDVLPAVEEVPHVAQGYVQLVAVTADGCYALSLPEDDAAHEGSTAFGLFLAGEAVVTQIRLLDEVRRGRRTF
jgi:hypothetical protein